MREILMAHGQVNIIGRKGESDAVRARFPVVEDFRRQYGDGTFALVAQRLGDPEPHAVPIDHDDESVFWTIGPVDTAVADHGYAELRYYVGETLAKSVRYRTFVEPSLSSGTVPPQPWQPWINSVIAAGASAEANAERVEEVASHIIGDLAWIVSTVEDGHLFFELSDHLAASGITLSINADGHLEVIYELQN